MSICSWLCRIGKGAARAKKKCIHESSVNGTVQR
jgi:hypothetical protein